MFSHYSTCMASLSEAVGLATETAARIRAMAHQALDDGSIADVEPIARLAEYIEREVTRLEASSGPASAPRSAASTSSSKKKSAAGRAPSKAAKPRRKVPLATMYPRFERDGDRLIKIGWSKKAREEYEHRAPKAAVDAVVHRLETGTTSDQVFAIDDLMPISQGDENDVPGYQVYIIMAWLREAGVVHKRGRDGYVKNGVALQDAVSEHWGTLDLRAHVEGAK